MRLIVAILAMVISLGASAKEPTSVGQGQYMLSAKCVTVFCSHDKLAAKLMDQANQFCANKNGKEAVLLKNSGEETEVGQFGAGGGHMATSAVYFQCGATSANTGTKADKYEALAKLKALLDSGAITQQEYDSQKKKLLDD